MEAELISKTVMALPGPTLMEATHVHHVAIVDDEHTGQNAPCIVWTPPRAHHTMPYVIKEPLLHPSSPSFVKTTLHSISLRCSGAGAVTLDPRSVKVSVHMTEWVLEHVSN
jgi:hypothetical protein